MIMITPAGRKMTNAPRKGMIDRTVIIAPQKTAEGMPVAAKEYTAQRPLN